MAILGTILSLAGLVVCLIFYIQILIKAFKTHILWGLGSLFIPFVGLVYVIKNWDDCKSPFLKSLIGVGIMIVGTILTVMGAASSAG